MTSHKASNMETIREKGSCDESICGSRNCASNLYFLRHSSKVLIVEAGRKFAVRSAVVGQGSEDTVENGAAGAVLVK